jgi:PEP-CTERM motif
MMRSFIFAAATALATYAAPAAAQVQWTTGPGANQHYYDFVNGPFTFSEALAAAATATPIAGYTAHLVTLTSLGESNFVFNNFGTRGVAWAAGSDAATEGVWQWVAGPEAGQVFWSNGTTVTYAAWHPGEPNNGGNGGDEDGVLLNQFGGITWNDAFMPTRVSYVVEWSLNGQQGAVPEPGTWGMMILGFGVVGSALRRRGATRASTAMA